MYLGDKSISRFVYTTSRYSSDAYNFFDIDHYVAKFRHGNLLNMMCWRSNFHVRTQNVNAEKREFQTWLEKQELSPDQKRQVVRLNKDGFK